jgi:hypothetical protein
MTSDAKPMRFGAVLLGLCFFCNPTFAALDVLPDFIGCLLICLGLSRVALIYPFIAETQKAFLKLAGVDAVKVVLLIAIFGMGSGNAEQPTSLLIVAFAAAVVELFFLLPALRRLFDDLYVLASRYECTELYTDQAGRASLTDRICKLFIVFVITREAVCLLPELTALTRSSFNDSAMDHLYEYIGIMRLLACVIVALFGLFLAVRLILYFAKVRRQLQMTAPLGKQYQDYYNSHPGIRVKRRHAVGFALMGAGGILLTDFYLDFQNVIPDHIAAILIGIGALFTMVPGALRGVTALLSAGYAAVSYTSSELSYLFAISFSPSALGKNREADLAYAKMWIWAMIELFVFVALMISVLLLLRRVIKEWAGYRAECAESDFEQRNHKELLASLDGRLLLCAALGFFAAVLSFLYDFIQTPSGKGIYHFLDFLWIFDFSLSVIFSVVFAITLTCIYTQIKNRYQYD